MRGGEEGGERGREREEEVAQLCSLLQSIPGGFNALARMYHEIQEPMMDAAQESVQPPSVTASPSPHLPPPPPSSLPPPPPPPPWLFSRYSNSCRATHSQLSSISSKV